MKRNKNTQCELTCKIIMILLGDYRITGKAIDMVHSKYNLGELMILLGKAMKWKQEETSKKMRTVQRVLKEMMEYGIIVNLYGKYRISPYLYVNLVKSANGTLREESELIDYFNK